MFILLSHKFSQIKYWDNNNGNKISIKQGIKSRGLDPRVGIESRYS